MAKILICTGIYPPHIGGPAQYAQEVEKELKRQGHSVSLLTYVIERQLPTFVRHVLFFTRTLGQLRGVDFILALDMFSVGLPAAFAAKLFRKKILIRTGGDFLWESFVERTMTRVLLRDFYITKKLEWSWKEKRIYNLTKWTLNNVSGVIFSTEWQRQIFEPAYALNPAKSYVVENFYGPKLPKAEKNNRVYVAATRPLMWKNIDTLKKVFVRAKEADPTIELDTENAPYETHLEKIRTGYAVALVSLGDISPNMILDSIRANTPFILTKENGLYERIKGIGLYVDPKDENDIKEKILYLADRTNHMYEQEKIENFTFTHTWAEICQEILAVAAAVDSKNK